MAIDVFDLPPLPELDTGGVQVGDFSSGGFEPIVPILGTEPTAFDLTTEPTDFDLIDRAQRIAGGTELLFDPATKEVFTQAGQLVASNVDPQNDPNWLTKITSSGWFKGLEGALGTNTGRLLGILGLGAAGVGIGQAITGGGGDLELPGPQPVTPAIQAGRNAIEHALITPGGRAPQSLAPGSLLGPGPTGTQDLSDAFRFGIAGHRNVADLLLGASARELQADAEQAPLERDIRLNALSGIQDFMAPSPNSLAYQPGVIDMVQGQGGTFSAADGGGGVRRVVLPGGDVRLIHPGGQITDQTGMPMIGDLGTVKQAGRPVSNHPAAAASADLRYLAQSTSGHRLQDPTTTQAIESLIRQWQAQRGPVSLEAQHRDVMRGILGREPTPEEFAAGKQPVDDLKLFGPSQGPVSTGGPPSLAPSAPINPSDIQGTQGTQLRYLAQQLGVDPNAFDLGTDVGQSSLLGALFDAARTRFGTVQGSDVPLPTGIDPLQSRQIADLYRTVPPPAAAPATPPTPGAPTAPGSRSVPLNQPRMLTPDQLLSATAFARPGALADPIQDELVRRVAAVSRGEISDPALEREMRQATEILRNQLFQAGGPGYELSTPGIEALTKLAESQAIQRYMDRQNTLGNLSSLELARRQFNLQFPEQRATSQFNRALNLSDFGERRRQAGLNERVQLTNLGRTPLPQITAGLNSLVPVSALTGLDSAEADRRFQQGLNTQVALENFRSEQASNAALANSISSLFGTGAGLALTGRPRAA